MSFITEASGVCLSATGSNFFPTCGSIIREGEEQYILQDERADLTIILDSDCGGGTASFECDIDRKEVESGKNVVIVNTCSLPLEITGFKNSDPLRFSLYEYPKFVNIEGDGVAGLYWSGNASDYLPLELDPFERVVIPVFFHPKREELEDGTAGTYDNRIGDTFNARVDVYPGFSVQNCEGDEAECEAYFTLSGEFICKKMLIPEWLPNNENFVELDPSTLASIENEVCLKYTGIWSVDIAAPYSPEAICTGIRDVAAEGATILTRNDVWREAPNAGWSGALGALHGLVDNLIEAEDHDDLDNLLNSRIQDYQVGCPVNGEMAIVSCSYTPGDTNIGVLPTPGGFLATGLNISASPVENVEVVSASTVYFGFIAPKVYMGVAETGDISLYNFCD